jgi:hypothetical protein
MLDEGGYGLLGFWRGARGHGFCSILAFLPSGRSRSLISVFRAMHTGQNISPRNQSHRNGRRGGTNRSYVLRRNRRRFRTVLNRDLCASYCIYVFYLSKHSAELELELRLRLRLELARSTPENLDVR